MQSKRKRNRREDTDVTIEELEEELGGTTRASGKDIPDFIPGNSLNERENKEIKGG